MNRPSTVIAYMNAGHAIDHFAILIFPTAVLAIGPAFGISYGELLHFAIPGFIAFGAGSLPAGWLGDRWSRRNTMLVFFFGTGISCVAMGLVQTPLQMSVALTALGLFTSIYHPVGTAMLVSYAERLGREVGINGVWGNLGVAFSAVVTGAICQYVGWRAAFIVPGVVSIILGVAFMRAVTHEVKAAVKDDPAELRVARSDMGRVVVILVVTVIALSTTYNAITVSLPKLFGERLGDLTNNTAVIGLIAAAIYVVAALAQSMVGRMIDRYPLKSIFLVISLVLAPLLLVAAQLSNTLLVLVSVGIVIAIFSQVTVNDAIVAKFTSDRWRARAYAARHFIGFCAAGVSVWLVAWLHESGGFALMLTSLGYVCVLIIVGAVAFPQERSFVARALQPAE